MDDGGRISRGSDLLEDDHQSGLSSAPAIRELRQPVTEPDVRSSAPPATDTAAVPPAPTKTRARRLRPILFGLLPLALLGAGFAYVTGGNVMSTDNAYVQADTVGVSTDVSGTVVEIEVRDNQPVKKGDVLFRIRPASFESAVAAAQAQLGTVRAQVLTLHAEYQAAIAQIQQARADIPFDQLAYRRQLDLAQKGAASQAALDQARQALEDAQQRVLVAQAQAQAALAQLNGDPNQPVEKNPFYLQAQAAMADAQRDLRDTVVHAPFDGVATNVSALQVGSYLKASQPAFSLVSTADVWVEASPKETELTWVRPGQPATVMVDTYPGVRFQGHIESISPASASSFSLLPAQNTTGNWVKVVQRIPMRVRIDDPSKGPPLRVGMSATVDVDTHHPNGFPNLLGWL